MTTILSFTFLGISFFYLLIVCSVLNNTKTFIDMRAREIIRRFNQGKENKSEEALEALNSLMLPDFETDQQNREYFYKLNIIERALLDL